MSNEERKNNNNEPFRNFRMLKQTHIKISTLFHVFKGNNRDI